MNNAPEVVVWPERQLVSAGGQALYARLLWRLFLRCASGHHLQFVVFCIVCEKQVDDFAIWGIPLFFDNLVQKRNILFGIHPRIESKIVFALPAKSSSINRHQIPPIT